MWVINVDINRDFSHPLDGRQLKAFYETGWFVRNVMYYNNCLKEIEVVFTHGTVDYISSGDVGKEDVFLI